MNQILPPETAQEQHTGSEADERRAEAERGARNGRIARRVGFGAVALLALAAGFGAWQHLAQHQSAQAALATRENTVPQVRVMQVKANDAPRVVDLPGTMLAFDAATIYARATGYIATRNVDIGSKVKQGDELVRIAAPDLDQQLAQARAQLAQMQASLAQSQAGRALAAANNRRTSTLVREGWNSQQQGDQDRTTFNTQTAGVRVAAANVLAQQAQVNRLVELTGFEHVTAPFGGVITARQVDVGTLVTADQSSGTPLFSIARSDVLRVQVYVPQADFFNLHDGDDATVTVPQLPGRVFHGRVARNAGALGADTRTLLTEVDVANPDGALSPGLYAIVHFQLRRNAPIVVVPSQAVIFNEDGLSAAVVENGRIALRKLIIDTDDGANVAVKDGLRTGDQLIVNPPVNLTPGMKVKTG